MREFTVFLVENPGIALLAVMMAACLAAGLAWRHVQAASPALREARGLRIAAVFGLAGFGVFVLAAVSLHAGSGIDAFDRLLAAGLAAEASPALLRLLSWFTHLGDRDGLIVLGAIVLAMLTWRRHGRLAVLWVIGTAGAGILNMVLKRGFARVRPEFLHGYADAQGWSFPSGHATGAMAVYGMLCYLVLRLAPPRWHLPSLLAASCLILAVGWSRVVLQVHYFSDVAAAFGVTAAWLALCVGLGHRALWAPGGA